jgi:hypothetical protein
MVKQAFVDATGAGGMFNGMLAKMADTTEGKMSNLSDSITSLKVAFGTGFNDGLKVALDAVSSKLPQLEESFSNMGKKIGDAIASAVAGDISKLTAIGDLIGSVIAAAATAAFQAGSVGIVAGAENAARGLGRNILGGVTGQGAAGAERMLPNMQGASFQELLDAALTNRGIREKIDAVMGAPPQTYIPSASSPGASSEFNDNRGIMLQEMQLQELKKLNQSGSKL